MRIENSGTFAQNSLLSGAWGTGTIPLPNYSNFNFNTKQAPAMSDEKYKEAIVEQAKQDQSEGKFQSDSVGYRNLIKSYVSAVSPDRKNIITQGLTAVSKDNTPQPKTLTLLDYLFGSVKYNKEDKNVSYVEFYDHNGEMVASCSNGKWISYGTKAENARESELRGIYNEAWSDAAKAGKVNSPVAGTGTTINQSV